MNKRLLFALGLLLSVILLVIGNLATLPIISLVGYGIMSLMFLLAGFTMAILRHTGALTANLNLLLMKKILLGTKLLGN